MSAPRLVPVRFRQQFEMDLLMGKKYATTRTTRLGAVGDGFVAFGQRFVFTKVEDLALFEVAAEHYQAEGFDTKEGFIDVWKKIHPRVGYQEWQRVWYHEFRMEQPARRAVSVEYRADG